MTAWKKAVREKKSLYEVYKHIAPFCSRNCSTLNLLFIHLFRMEHLVSIFAICLYSASDNQDPSLYMDLQFTAIQTVTLQQDFTTDSERSQSFDCAQNTC